jgi:Zn-dependent protease
VFNVIPAAPLDGGRLLQAVLWCISKDRLKAPGMASRAGPEGSWLPA